MGCVRRRVWGEAHPERDYDDYSSAKCLHCIGYGWSIFFIFFITMTISFPSLSVIVFVIIIPADLHTQSLSEELVGAARLAQSCSAVQRHVVPCCAKVV